MLGYLVVSIVHRTVTWTAGSLTCVCDLFAYVCTRGTSVYRLIRRTFVEPAQKEVDSEEISGRAQSLAHNGHPPFGDHAPSCLTLAFRASTLDCATDSFLTRIIHILVTQLSLVVSKNSKTKRKKTKQTQNCTVYFVSNQ